ncbi:unnamed protein product [Gongylonema pulchrum]|uniref:TFIIS N-terminal domain-containing protein n=1 Tax=Gongylonema pulchrum TaxID=637853 RepID=A0A183E9Z2_9BILA|nr:unnamed protein product [Gongylonema pulchrum]
MPKWAICLIGHALRRLASIEMTLALLSATGVGKAVNQLRNDETHGPEALRIVQKWKDMARSCGLKPKRKRSRSPSSEHEKSSPVKLKKKNSHSEDSGTGSSNEGTRKDAREGASCSGVSFAEMLARADTAKPFKPKKFKVDNNHWKSSKVDANYKPSKVLNFEPTPKERQSGITVHKIYAGRPKGDLLKEVPTLQNLCVKVLIANIDAIYEVGDTPYFLLKPVLEKCSVDQLTLIEKRNPVSISSSALL